MSLSTKEHWNRVYDGVKKRYGLYLYQRQLVEIIQSCYATLEGKRLLEVGCGKGNELTQLSEQGASCVGVDFSESALGLLKSRILKEQTSITLIQADANNLPFKEMSFDMVFSQGVLEHFLDPSRVILEQHRCLKENGFIVVEVPNKWTVYSVYKHILMLLKRWAPGWETQYSPGELRSLLEKNGFRVQSCFGWDFFLLKVFRRLRRMIGLKDSSESRIVHRIRTSVQENKFLLNFFASITMVGVKSQTL